MYQLTLFYCSHLLDYLYVSELVIGSILLFLSVVLASCIWTHDWIRTTVLVCCTRFMFLNSWFDLWLDLYFCSRLLYSRHLSELLIVSVLLFLSVGRASCIWTFDRICTTVLVCWNCFMYLNSFSVLGLDRVPLCISYSITF